MTFSESYLKNLTVGVHRIDFQYTGDRTVSTALPITDQEKETKMDSLGTLAGTVVSVKDQSTQTGDSTPGTMVLFIFSLSVVGLMITKKVWNKG